VGLFTATTKAREGVHPPKTGISFASPDTEAGPSLSTCDCHIICLCFARVKAVLKSRRM
jgi:hypothetical protein